MRISDWSSDVCSSDLRVDHPAVAVVLAFADAAFLHQEAEVGPCLAQVLADDAPRLGIGRRDEIRGSLAADLKLFDLAEVADKGSARHLGGPGHDVDVCGSGGTRLRLPCRSETRRVGQGCLRTGKYRWAPYHIKKK